MKHSIKRIVSWMIVLCMVLSFVPAASAVRVTWEKTDQKITADRPDDRLVQKDESAQRDPSELVRVSIVLEKPSAVEAGFATMGIASNAKAVNYRAQLQAAQRFHREPSLRIRPSNPQGSISYCYPIYRINPANSYQIIRRICSIFHQT